jgi:AraC family transcriptional regulator
MQLPELHIGAPHQAGPFSIRRIDYPPGLRQPRHSHEAGSLTVLLAGEIRETTRAGEAIGSALSVVVKPAGVEHADEVGPRGARTVQVAIVPEVAQELASEALGRWRWLHGGPASAPLLSLARALWVGQLRVELEDRVLDAVATLGDTDPAGYTAPGWLARVKEVLDDELEAELGVRELARRVGAHPVSVSRAFRRHYGVTITEYRRRERVRRAAARIAASSLSLSHIAHRTGHADHPHLCREFRRLTGLTPSQFRRLARVG